MVRGGLVATGSTFFTFWCGELKLGEYFVALYDLNLVVRILALLKANRANRGRC